MSDRPAIYPARRAIERAVATPGARPTRLFGVLIPIWRIEASVIVTETEPYEVFDQFITRGIAEAGLHTPNELVRFFGIEPSIVDRTLRFLISLGHVEWAGSGLRLTMLGEESARAGVRRIVREDRRHLYFDGYTSGPLPTGHYTGVRYLRDPSLHGKDGTDFRAAGLTNPFRDAEIAALLARPDRREYNISDGVHSARPLTTQQVWLPAYLVEDAGPLRMQAFTMASEQHDQHIERVCADLGAALREQEDREDPVEMWERWLNARDLPGVTPQRMPNGVLRATLPASAFRKPFALYQLGSFESYRRTFMQLWCDDADLRREAALEQVTRLTRHRRSNSGDYTEDRITQISARLEIPRVDQ